MIEDKLLLRAYNDGWFEELDIANGSVTPSVYENKFLQFSYDLGREHFALSDELIDGLSDEEILALIKIKFDEKKT